MAGSRGSGCCSGTGEGKGVELPSLLGCSTAQYGTSGHRGEAWPGVDDADRAGQAATGLPACADVALLTWPAASTCCRFGLLCAAGAGCVAAAAPAGRHLFSPDLAAAEVGGPPLADVGSGASAGFSRAAPAVQRFFFCAHCCSSAFCLRRSLCLFRLCLQLRRASSNSGRFWKRPHCWQKRTLGPSTSSCRCGAWLCSTHIRYLTW